jgi:transcriptional regulator with XRE-family HTH domain
MQSTLADRLKTAMAGPPKQTGRALAQACGVSPPSVSDWLSGKSKSMEGSNLLAASEFLKVRPKWLAEGVGSMRTSAGFESEHLAKKPDVSYLPHPKVDKLQTELLELFGKLDTQSKREMMNLVRGFVAGRSPHSVGPTPAVAVTK